MRPWHKMRRDSPMSLREDTSHRPGAINTNQKMGVIIVTIHKTLNGNMLSVALEGRLDTTTAPQLEAELKASMEGITKLDLDFEKLEYLSSAGLRVLLAAQKTMNKQGKMVVRHVNDSIYEVFEVTGFTDILTIQ